MKRWVYLSIYIAQSKGFKPDHLKTGFVMFKILVFTSCFVAIWAVPVEYGHKGYREIDYYTEPHYYFEYNVNDLHTADVKSHKEQRKGDHTEGVYSVLEPGGSKRVVEYNVQGKKGGFVTKVHRGPVKLIDKKGHVGVSGANLNSYQKEVQDVVYKNHGSSGSYGEFHGGESGSFGGSHQLSLGNVDSSFGGDFYSYGQGGQGDPSRQGSSSKLPGSRLGEHQHQFYLGNVGNSYGGSFEHQYQPYSLGEGSHTGSEQSPLQYSHKGNEVGLTGGTFGSVYGYGKNQFKPSYSVKEAGQDGSSGSSAGTFQYSHQSNAGGSQGTLNGGSFSDQYYNNGGSFGANLRELGSYGHGGLLQPTYLVRGGYEDYSPGVSQQGNLDGSVGGYEILSSQNGNKGVSSGGLSSQRNAGESAGYNLFSSHNGNEGGSSGGSLQEVQSFGFRGHLLQPYYLDGGVSTEQGSYGNYQLQSSHPGFQGSLESGSLRGYEHLYNGEGGSAGFLGRGSLDGYHLLSHNSNSGGSSEGSFGNVLVHGYGGHLIQPSKIVEGINGGLSSNYVSSGENPLQSVHQTGESGSSVSSRESNLNGYQQYGNKGGSSVGSLGGGYQLISSNNGHEVSLDSGSAQSHGFGGHRLQPTYVSKESGQGGSLRSSVGNVGSSYGQEGYGNVGNVSTNGAKTYTSTKHLSPKNYG